MHPLNGPYVAVRVTRGIPLSHFGRLMRRLAAELAVPHDFHSSVSVSLCDLADHVIDGVGLAGCKSRENACFYLMVVFYYFSFSLLSLCTVGAVVFGLIG